MRAGVLALVAALISACTSASSIHSSSCLDGAIQLHADFEGARANDCTRLGAAEFKIVISPEAQPINPSPWYAFDIVSDRSAVASVMLNYVDARHRYRPKLSRSDRAWSPLDVNATTLFDDGRSASMSMNVEPGRLRIAAQEVLPPSERSAWLRGLADRAGFEVYELTRSVEGRPIWAFQLGMCERRYPLIIVLGGQHPPEVPGVLGLRSFLETLLLSAPRARELQDEACLLVVPDLNPDGVARGHWRLNKNLIDLNRDWGPFTQPETRAVEAMIAQLARIGLRPSLLLDFHATRRNTFYTPPDHLDLIPASFSANWLALIETAWDGEMPDRSANHNADLPTAKAWFAETYAAPGITFEFGDEVSRSEISDLAHVAALMLIEMYAPPLSEEP